ncbi:MAG: SDR family oxidoreductase [Saprospiraceae bacterium]|nr:SDR family oxidoreductase [Saprospiraceae bacterium]
MTNILVTGGAGFIGANLVEKLLTLENVSKVRVLDNFSTGTRQNLQNFEGHRKYECLEGDIRNYAVCLTACKDMHLVAHQAALGSVPRSIVDPLSTNGVNITGTLNVFTAAKESGIRRVVYAASSSTYGDNKELPKREHRIGKPLSPYAVTKLVNELYADVFSSLYGMEMIGLRYFNVFGPRQSPDGAYAAVIPLFLKQLYANESPTIHGDGLTSRDFTYIENVLQANCLALFTTKTTALNQVYNVACNEATTLNELFEYLKKMTNSPVSPIYAGMRIGNITHSIADISKIKKRLGYIPFVKLEEGLQRTVEWFKRENHV